MADPGAPTRSASTPRARDGGFRARGRSRGSMGAARAGRVGDSGRMRENFGSLTAGQAEHFLERGYGHVPGAFDAASARQRKEGAWTLCEYDRDDPATWAEERIHLSSRSHVAAWAFRPAAWLSA